MTGNNRHLSILTLHVNGLNVQSKDKEQKTGFKNKTLSNGSYKRLISLKKNTDLESKIFLANGPHKHTSIALLISNKVVFRQKSIRRDNEGHFIFNKGIINQEEIPILNIHAPHTGAPIYITKKKTLMDLRAQIDCNTAIVGDLNTHCHQ
jgi:hypothetical protein